MGQARPNKRPSQRDRKFSKIENLWPRDDSCSYKQQKTQNCIADSANSSGFPIIWSKYCFMEPLPSAGGGFGGWVVFMSVRRGACPLRAIGWLHKVVRADIESAPTPTKNIWPRRGQTVGQRKSVKKNAALLHFLAFPSNDHPFGVPRGRAP